MVQLSQIICPNPDCHRQIPRDAKFCPFCRHDAVLNNEIPSDDRRYSITRIVKQGGQGSVYEGIDQYGRVYAIKEMLDSFTDAKERTEALSRFNAESALLQKLTHPRIPRVYSHFTDEGRHYLTMDFVRGEDLEQIVEREGRVPEATVLEWADQICDVLNYLHTNGLIYRDMKPSNVMIDAQDGKVKLVDFGIAKFFKPTERGTQIGTPGYAPPEQYQGLATPVSDIYALGATLHHLVTGQDPTDQPPFSFRPARDLNVNISRRTSDALAKALNMEPMERFQTVPEFRSMLRPLAANPRPQTHVPARNQSPAATIALPRVANAPAAVPSGRGSAQAQSGATAQSAPVRSSVATPPLTVPGAGHTQATAATKRAARLPRKRRWPGCIGQFIGILFITVGIGALAFFFLPDLIDQYLLGVSSGESGPIQLAPPDELALELTITVPATADDNAIRAEFTRVYRERVEQDYPGAVINPNVPPAPIGMWEDLGQTGDTAQYQATVQGLVQLPQGP